jgi:hypothetical protein
VNCEPAWRSLPLRRLPRPRIAGVIDSWFGQTKERCAWRCKWDSIDQARQDITAYIDGYHQRPHSGPGYRTRQGRGNPARSALFDEVTGAGRSRFVA